MARRKLSERRTNKIAAPPSRPRAAPRASAPASAWRNSSRMSQLRTSPEPRHLGESGGASGEARVDADRDKAGRALLQSSAGHAHVVDGVGIVTLQDLRFIRNEAVELARKPTPALFAAFLGRRCIASAGSPVPLAYPVRLWRTCRSGVVDLPCYVPQKVDREYLGSRGSEGGSRFEDPWEPRRAVSIKVLIVYSVLGKVTTGRLIELTFLRHYAINAILNLFRGETFELTLKSLLRVRCRARQ